MNEIVPAENLSLQVERAPIAILEEAKVAAKALDDVISKKKKPVKFNGEQYLEFEDWQTIGKFYGLACSTLKPAEVTVDGVVGAEAEAEVVDVRSGRIIGRASAWCLRDEPNWRAKPLYQLGSMAQTRAGAKALRNLLSWVVVLAGYKTTPAEEMQAEGEHEKRNNDTRLVRSDDGVSDSRASNVVHDILDKLVAIHKGNQDEIEKHLRQITTYKSKTGEEKFLRTSDLEGVFERRPEWIERIHTKVTADFIRAKQL